MNENVIGKEVVDAALQIHREFGPGLLESVYEAVLARELESRGLRGERQVPVPIQYRGLRFDLLNFGANLMKDGIDRIVNGLSEENLGVLASLRERQIQVEPGGKGRLTPRR